jgi:alcohol dehydrogenase class IV
MTVAFHSPRKIIIDGGAIGSVPAEVARLGATCALLVADPFLVGNGTAPQLKQACEHIGITVNIFDQVHPDPRDVDVIAAGEAAKQLADRHGNVVVVGLGGGSALDTAKVAAVLATNNGGLAGIAGADRILRDGYPVIAIPSTAGTGSEATKVAVITDTRDNIKVLINDARLMPSCSIVDFELTLSMPPALTAHVGLDTLTHGIEAYVSRRANAFSDPLALKCVSLVAAHLETAFFEPANRAARSAMMEAATLGGLAFTNSSVALVHAMARPIGALFHLSHGLSNAVLLPTITRFSLHAAMDRYAEVARSMRVANGADDDATAAEKLLEELKRLNRVLQIQPLGQQLPLTPDAFRANLPKMACDALASGSADNNPVVPTQAQIEQLYDQTFSTAEL